MGIPQIDLMRSELIKRFPFKKWKDKVKNMSDEQVIEQAIAIYLMMKKSGEQNGNPSDRSDES